MNTQHESYPVSDALAAMGFITKWDGSQEIIDASESAQAAQLLDKCVEGLQVSYADFTIGTFMTYLMLERVFADDSVATFVLTTSKIMRECGGKSGTLRVLETDRFGVYHETYDYEISNKKDEVRRIDVGDESFNSTLSTLGQSTGGARVYIDGVRQDYNSPSINENARNTALEDQMGLNNQPVGVSEIQSLIALITDAKPVDVS